MATINYNGMKLEEFTSDNPVIFDPPKECICWDEEKDADYHNKEDDFVLAYIPLARSPFITKGGAWYHGAIFPEKPAPRIATNRELAKWIAQGKGEMCSEDDGANLAYNNYDYEIDYEDESVKDIIKVRKWDDTEWHTPDVEYMGITEVKTYEDVVKREG